MNFFTRFFTKKTTLSPVTERGGKAMKQEGSTLVITLILCGMIITVGLGVVRILVSELQFSADLLWAERSYFSAESGVEKALLELKGDPILHITNDPVYRLEDLDGAKTFLTIWNKLDETNNEINIPGANAVKLRLAHEINTNNTKTGVVITDLEWKIDGNAGEDLILWKVICPDQSLSGRIMGTNEALAPFKEAVGDHSWMNNDIPQVDKNVKVSTFWSGIETNDKKECWLSLQNISSSPLKVTLNTDITMPPAIAKVTSIGKSGKREKIVEFLYRQKNLSPYFDFGVLQQD